MTVNPATSSDMQDAETMLVPLPSLRRLVRKSGGHSSSNGCPSSVPFASKKKSASESVSESVSVSASPSEPTVSSLSPLQDQPKSASISSRVHMGPPVVH